MNAALFINNLINSFGSADRVRQVCHKMKSFLRFERLLARVRPVVRNCDHLSSITILFFCFAADKRSNLRQNG